MSEEIVVRFFAALEAGDIGTLREIYAPDALIWHNDDLLEQSVEDNLTVLQGLHRAVAGLRYDVIRRAAVSDGVLQQHVLARHVAERGGGRTARRHVPAGAGRPRDQDRGVPRFGEALLDPRRSRGAGHGTRCVLTSGESGPGLC